MINKIKSLTSASVNERIIICVYISADYLEKESSDAFRRNISQAEKENSNPCEGAQSVVQKGFFSFPTSPE